MKTTHKILLTAAATLLAAGLSSQAKATTAVTLGTDGATSPYTYVKNGKLTGYDIAVTKAVFAKLPQFKVTYKQADFNSVIAGLTANRYQLVSNDIGYTAARAKQYYYSNPLSISNDAVAVKSGKVTQLSQLAGKSTEGLASSNFTTAIQNFNKTASKKIKLNYVDGNYPLAQRLSDVASGKTDFILYDAVSLKTVIKQSGLDLKVDKIKDTGNDPKHDGYDYMIFAKTPTGKKLQTAVNKELKKLAANGTLKKLSVKYLGGNFVPAASHYTGKIN